MTRETIEKITTAKNIAAVGFIIIIAALMSVATFSIHPGSVEESSITVTNTFPEPTNFAVDTSDTLTVEQLERLNTQLKEINDSKKAQIAVVLVNTIGRYSIEEYSIKLARLWKVGEADTDNGIILVIAKQERKVRIEVGNGMEGVLNDAKAGRILNETIIPELKKGDWFSAIEKGVETINNNI